MQKENNDSQVWRNFSDTNKINTKQTEKFKKFRKLLVKANEIFNITRITKLENFLAYHVEDSLIIRNFLDLKKIEGLVDVGSGGGFPGIPIKILFPKIKIILIEVSKKKIEFLKHVIQELDLKKIEVYELDWRTFIRKTNYNVELFCARASIKPIELIRIFKASCYYKNSIAAYWAGKDWTPSEKEEKLLKFVHPYKIKNKTRKTVFFASFSREEAAI